MNNNGHDLENREFYLKAMADISGGNPKGNKIFPFRLSSILPRKYIIGAATPAKIFIASVA